jgi:hypothetical protein
MEKQIQSFYVADAKQTFHAILKNDGGTYDILLRLYFATVSTCI